jgi:hypothetical protein
MYCEITAFAFIEGKKLYVEFENSQKGLFDMSKYIVSDFFSALDNDSYFKRAYLHYGVLTWPQGQDISPETVALELIPYELPHDIHLIQQKPKLQCE